MIPVRQSTAFECAIGPVLDADGVAVTDCVVGDFKLKKTTGNFAALDGSATLTHVSAGTYDLVLTTSDLDTVGLATVAIDDTTNACAMLYLQVLEEAVFDAIYAPSTSGYQLPIWASASSTVNLSNTTVKTLTDAPSDSSGTTTLLSRLSATRAGYLDNLSAGAVATASALTSAAADITTLLGKFTGITLLAQWLGLLAGKQTGNSTARTEMRATGAGSGTYDETAHSLEALRERGDAAWTTGGGGSLSDILQVVPLIPQSIDLADTATWKVGLQLINVLDDLPSTGEITPGTISIDRKAQGGTSWTSVVSDAACSESAGLVYYDEVFDSGTGYALGDSIRITFKSQKITVSANDYEITGSGGVIFTTHIRMDAAIRTDTQAIITSLGDIDSFSNQMDDQGYTLVRAANLDNADVATSTRQTSIWASATSTVGLTNTTISTTQTVGLNDGAITAAKVAASALDNKGNWNVGKTGYALTQPFPTNFEDLSIEDTTGKVTTDVTLSPEDITSIGEAAASGIWTVQTSALDDAGSIGKLLVDNVDAPVSEAGGGSFPLTGDPLTNFTFFFTNDDALTTKTIDNVTAPTNVEVQIGQ